MSFLWHKSTRLYYMCENTMWQELLLRQRHYSVNCSLSIVPFICKEAQRLSGLLDSVFFLTDCDLFMETQIVKSALLNFPIVASLEILVFILEVSKWVAFMWDANQDIHDTPFWDRSLLHSSCWPQTLDPPALFLFYTSVRLHVCTTMFGLIIPGFYWA